MLCNWQISEGMAASIQKLLVEAGSTQSRPASTLEMVVMLLQIARPGHFQSFRSFVQWRQASAAAICQSLALGAAGVASDTHTSIQFICGRILSASFFWG